MIIQTNNEIRTYIIEEGDVEHLGIALDIFYQQTVPAILAEEGIIEIDVEFGGLDKSRAVMIVKILK
jgi:predicted metal-dependent TIM-barrel fold hydrolase